jgi:hypothetical protein
MSLNPDTNKVKGYHQTNINIDSKNHKGGDESNTNVGPNNPRVNFHSHTNPESEYQGIIKKKMQAMIAQQMQVMGGGYAIMPVRNCGHSYPSIYDLKEYPKRYVIPKFKVLSGEGNRYLNPK